MHVQTTRRCPFVALFRAAGYGGFRRPHALVSRSTAGLRQMLREQGVQFSMPLLPASSRAVQTPAEIADFLQANVGRVRRCRLNPGR